jgi:hypothetical protein
MVDSGATAGGPGVVKIGSPWTVAEAVDHLTGLIAVGA